MVLTSLRGLRMIGPQTFQPADSLIRQVWFVRQDGSLDQRDMQRRQILRLVYLPGLFQRLVQGGDRVRQIQPQPCPRADDQCDMRITSVCPSRVSTSSAICKASP